MSRPLKIYVTLFTVWLALPILSWGQAAPQKPPAKPPMPQSDQMTNIPYFTLRDGMNSILTLQNVVAAPTTVAITVFNMEGRPRELAPVTLDPHSVKTLSLRDVLPDEDWNSGNLGIAFHGQSMALTAQVTVSSTEKRISFESREQDMMDFETTKLNGILWLPQPDAKGYLALTNASKNQTTIQLAVGSKKKEIPLASRETRLVNLTEFENRSPEPTVVHLEFNGLPGDIITTGFVLDEKTGYSAGLPMVDPGIMRSSHLAGVHFRFGQPDPSEGFPEGTEFHSPLLLANVSDKPVTAHIFVDYSIENKQTATTKAPSTQPPAPRFKVTNLSAGDVVLNPGSAKSIELSSALAGVAANTVNDVGVDIDYDSAPGAVIGQLTSLNKNGDFPFEVPIKDPKAMNVQMEGVNPWSLENGDNTTLHIKNTTDKVAHALAGLNFPGGRYSLGEIELQPYQTIAINVGTIKTSKTPDAVGHVIPADAVLGQFVWWQENPYTLLGRSEHENVKAGTASSFSCFGSGCCTNYADYYSGGASPLVDAVGTSDFFTVTKEWYDCGGNYYEYTTFPNAGYYSDDTNIATVSEVMVGQVNGTAEDTVNFIGAGTTNIHAYYAQKYYTGLDSNNTCQGPFLYPAEDYGAAATGCDFAITPSNQTIVGGICDAIHDNQVGFNAVNIPNGCSIIGSGSSAQTQQSGSVHVDLDNTICGIGQYGAQCTVFYTAGPGNGSFTLYLNLKFYGTSGSEPVIQHTSTQTIQCP